MTDTGRKIAPGGDRGSGTPPARGSKSRTAKETRPMLIALPSGHWHIADALAEAGLTVVHVDQHVRDHLTALDPLVSSAPTLANVGGGGHLSRQLDEARGHVERQLHRQVGRADRLETSASGDRITGTRHHYNEDRRRYVTETVHMDLFDEAAGRNPELRRILDAARRVLPAPDFVDVDVVVGVDTDAQRALLPDEVRAVAIAGQVPAWAIGGDLRVIDANQPTDRQATRAVEACGLVPA